MNSGNPDRWIIDVDEVETAFDTADAAGRHLDTLADQPTGKFSVLVDHGPVRGWKRFLGQKRDVSPCLAVEWHGPYANLIFHDDAWSEYRAIDAERTVSATDEERRLIAHGEVTPHPATECMEKARAFQAIGEFITTRTRPSWLSYRYVP